jgi:hypothetical protein
VQALAAGLLLPRSHLDVAAHEVTRWFGAQ